MDKLPDRIGVLGGTFNPIHSAHVRMARLYMESLQLDELLLVPTSVPPHKPTCELAPAEDRVAMCRLAVEGQLRIVVSDFEVRRPGPSYTVHTLEYLRRQHPQAELYLLMGTDMFLTVQRWREPRRIAELAVLCAMPREPGERDRLLQHKRYLEGRGARCVVLETAALPVSSTLVREKLRAGENVQELLHPEVLRYIWKKGLYGSQKRGAGNVL